MTVCNSVTEARHYFTETFNKLRLASKDFQVRKFSHDGKSYHALQFAFIREGDSGLPWKIETSEWRALELAADAVDYQMMRNDNLVGSIRKIPGYDNRALKKYLRFACFIPKSIIAAYEKLPNDLATEVIAWQPYLRGDPAMHQFLVDVAQLQDEFVAWVNDGELPNRLEQMQYLKPVKDGFMHCLGYFPPESEAYRTVRHLYETFETLNPFFFSRPTTSYWD